ncbi:hypothetical protein ONJ17_27555, partial [Salmonella enterica subsp. enterica serovar Agona]|nr:hypothetical protein [Salmonella enterica subsp. enterica serovar Agona]
MGDQIFPRQFLIQLAYIKVNERAKGLDGINSPVAKFLTADIVDAILERTGAQDGD